MSRIVAQKLFGAGIAAGLAVAGTVQCREVGPYVNGDLPKQTTERTFIAVKPDGMNRGLAGDVSVR